MTLRSVHALFAGALLTGCASTSMPEVAAQPAVGRQLPPSPAEPPRLILMITVDQMRGDYYDRFRPQFTGGLRRLFEGGAFFTNAFQDHAITLTAPGHASVLSGRFPRGTGIVSNAAGVLDPQSPLVGGVGPGASPFRFRGGTLVDWLRMRDPRSRALSVSGKDRGAILTLGRAKQPAYWYAAASGTFATSTYYHDTLPDWVRAFNARRLPAAHAGRAWTLLRAESDYPEPDSVAVEAGGGRVTFPHALPADTLAAVRLLLGTPFADELVLHLALAGVRSLRLGAGPSTDVLAVSLSATDYIGHAYGPDSREVHDQLLRLDEMLGWFLDSLAAIVEPSRTVIALTGDHGVAPLPGAVAGRPPAQAVSLSRHAERLRGSLAARRADPSAARFEDVMLVLDRPALARARVDADSLLRAEADSLRADPGVHRVHLARDLARDSARDPIARRWAHMLPADAPIELVVTFRPYDLQAPLRYAQHGSPHDYDAHVPLVLYGAPFRPGRHASMARVVDIAPTLAWAAGVTPTEPLDGRMLSAAVR